MTENERNLIHSIFVVVFPGRISGNEEEMLEKIYEKLKYSNVDLNIVQRKINQINESLEDTKRNLRTSERLLEEIEEEIKYEQ